MDTEIPDFVEQVNALASLEEYIYLEPDSAAILVLIKDMLKFICNGKYMLLYAVRIYRITNYNS